MGSIRHIVWDISPEIFKIGPLVLRWYGLFFAMAFLAGFLIMARIYRLEGKDPAELDPLLLHVALGAVIGARIGHCVFYDPVYYFSDPVRILRIWEGGLASHGGVAGILVALAFFVWQRPAEGYLRLLDRLSIPAALGGAMIRTGNLFNSEILGLPSSLPWAVIFARVDAVPRHPVQVYEAIVCLTVFLILVFIRGNNSKPPEGVLLGWLLTGVFSARFLLEFVKMRQAAYGFGLPFTVGQLLSLPLIAIGICLLIRQRRSQGRP